VRGMISDAMSRPVKIHMRKLQCLSRELAIEEDEEDDDDDLLLFKLQEAFSVAFNFFWHPLVEFVPPSTKPVEIME